MIYFPQPRDSGIGAKLLALDRDGERVLVTTHPREGHDAVLYFGGNAEDVSPSLDEFREAFPHHSIYLMHYRGYGGSSGKPSEEALVGDALALFDHVAARQERVTLVGRSLGSGVAMRVAAERPANRLVLVTPFDSLLGIAAEQYPYFPVRWLLKDRFESGRLAAKVTEPTLLLAAEHDDVIPRASTELLRTRFQPGVASYAVVRGGNHNTISASPEYWRLLRGDER